MTGTATIRLAAVIEGATMTGPVRNLIEFCQRARNINEVFPGMPVIETSVITFQRMDGCGKNRDPRSHNIAEAASPNQFVESARAAGIDVTVIPERYRFDTKVIELEPWLTDSQK